MAIVLPINNFHCKPFSLVSPVVNPNITFSSLKPPTNRKHESVFFTSIKKKHRQRRGLFPIFNCLEKDSGSVQNDEESNLGVKAALSMLRFYKREISPLLPNSCRYVPTCSEYSMIAYKKYGVVKGTVLTAWRLCRCNPLGGSGFDPPRWFDETSPPDQ
ncbi:hypothetical protein F0562_016312 [Nyssa sinensis]|uniref:Membrane protein insertion efficiency factor n=1 Tax=Nyssa sinensis TaxID=561372 RepID=A0A5J4ZM98_9ASTE|nr:hypothetical protein F0562_016312 [Nyssa sinensis]